MEKRIKGNGPNVNHGILPLDGVFLDGLYSLSGRKALERVFNHPDPPRLIQNMSSEDFFMAGQKGGCG